METKPTFDSAYQNNSRDIAKSLEQAFKRSPSDYSKERLENIGYTVDFSSRDWGNEMPEGHEVMDNNADAEYDEKADEELLKDLPDNI